MSPVEERIGKHVFRTNADGSYLDQMGYSEWLGEYCVGPMAYGEEPRMRSFSREKALRALRTGTCDCGVHLLYCENHRCGEDVALYAELSAQAFAKERAS